MRPQFELQVWLGIRILLSTNASYTMNIYGFLGIFLLGKINQSGRDCHKHFQTECDTPTPFPSLFFHDRETRIVMCKCILIWKSIQTEFVINNLFVNLHRCFILKEYISMEY